MHRRCQAVYISDDCDALLSSLVVVDCAWFIRAVDAATAEAARCPGALVDAGTLARAIFSADNSSYTAADAAAAKLSSAQSLVVHWLVAAFRVLGVCTQFGVSTATGSRLLLFADQLELGAPSRDVWPDRPEVDERQVT